MFDSKIKEVRLKKGITQEELANMTEISQSYISKIENKNYKFLKSDNANKMLQLAKALDCCPVELYSINCSKCKIRKTQEEILECRNNMVEKGYSLKAFNLD